MSGDHIKKFVPHLRLRLILIVSIVLLGSNAKAQQGAVPVPNLDSAALNDILGHCQLNSRMNSIKLRNRNKRSVLLAMAYTNDLIP